MNKLFNSQMIMTDIKKDLLFTIERDFFYFVLLLIAIHKNGFKSTDGLILKALMQAFLWNSEDMILIQQLNCQRHNLIVRLFIGCSSLRNREDGGG